MRQERTVQAIRAILPSGEAGSAGDAQMIDLEGPFLIPGLWDVHIHPDPAARSWSPDA